MPLTEFICLPTLFSENEILNIKKYLASEAMIMLRIL